MTTLNAATIATMNRAAIWAYITDNSLSVTKKRSTEDARQALIAYFETTEEPAEIGQPTTAENSQEPAEIEQPTTAENSQETAEIEQPTTVENSQESAEIGQPTTIGSSIVILVMVTAIWITVNAIWIVFTQLVVPTAIWIGKQVKIAYKAIINRYSRQSTAAIDYFSDLAEVG